MKKGTKTVGCIARLPARSWQRYTAGPGAKASATTTRPSSSSPPPTSTASTTCSSPGNNRTGELAFYRAYSPHPVPLTTLVRVAGRRWAVEEAFQAGKELAALDEHQVRGWTSWHRWTVLAMLAHAFLSFITAAEHPTRRHRPG